MTLVFDRLVYRQFKKENVRNVKEDANPRKNIVKELKESSLNIFDERGQWDKINDHNKVSLTFDDIHVFNCFPLV